MNAHSKYGRKCNKNNDDCDDYHNLALLHTLLLLLLNIHSSLLDLIWSFLISVAASFSVEFSNTLLISGERRQKTKMKNSKFVFFATNGLSSLQKAVMAALDKNVIQRPRV